MSRTRPFPLTSSRWAVTLLLVLAMTLPLALQPASAQTRSFEDVNDGPHAPAIERLAADGIVRGCTTKRFCPSDRLTRAQLAAILTRALELPEAPSNAFDDVPRDHVHAGAIGAAHRAGIVLGNDGHFRPGSTVTRGQVASMIARAYDLPDAPQEADVFGDITGSVHADAIGALVAARVTSGCGAGRFCPGDGTTRAQAASFVDRARDPSNPAPLPVGRLSHEALLAEVEGFGHRTTGGAGGREVWVTTTADSGRGSLREAAESSGAAWIRFDPAVFPPSRGARIRLASPIDAAGDKTIDGRGAQVIIQNHGFFVDQDNVIATNLIFDFAEEHTYYQGNSAFTIGWPRHGVQDVWIHRNTFRGSGPGELDGAVDILRDANRITVSWNEFLRWDKTMLLATDATTESEAADRISIHHNWFHENSQRQPLARFGRFHVWNNWFERWDFNGSYGEAIVTTSGAQVLSERNLFDHDQAYRAILTMDEGAGLGYARDVGSHFGGPVTAELHRPERVTFDPRDDHAYRADPVDTSAQRQQLRDRLRSGTGWQAH